MDERRQCTRNCYFRNAASTVDHRCRSKIRRQSSQGVVICVAARLSVVCTDRNFYHPGGRRIWEGWILAAVNSVIICVISVRRRRRDSFPPTYFGIVLVWDHLRSWRKAAAAHDAWCRIRCIHNRELPGGCGTSV